MELSSSKNKKFQNRTSGAQKIKKKHFEKTSSITGNETF